jgi:adenine C2-methylase RlmN of 23S rRNA A2503 and tRNA A37
VNIESFRNYDNSIGKYIHDDDSESCIKMVSSCDTIIDPVTGKFHKNNIDRQKYSIFVSSSVGCFMKCEFCYLTIKNSRYAKIVKNQLIDNVKEAVVEESKENPIIKR